MDDAGPYDRNISAYFHCADCVRELETRKASATAPPLPYSALAVGYTKAGLQVWCERHNVNLIHIDFEGHKHPAWIGAKRAPTVQ